MSKSFLNNAAVEIDLEAFSEEGESRKFSKAEKNLELNSVSVEVFHQKLVIKEKLQIDTVKIKFTSAAVVDEDFIKDLFLYLKSEDELDEAEYISSKQG